MEEFLDPIKIISELDLMPGMEAGDFGCGSGNWTIPLAKRIKPGRVFAFDVLEEPISVLTSRMRSERVFNIEFRIANVERGVPLRDDSLDWVFMTNLLFECTNKLAVLKEAERVLKKNGKILIVDWEKDNPLTPQIEFCDKEEIKRLGESIGLSLKREFKAGIYHWGLIFEKI